MASTFLEEGKRHLQVNRHSKRLPPLILQQAVKDSIRRCFRKQTQRRATGLTLFTSSNKLRQLSSSARVFRFETTCKEAALGLCSNSGRHSLVQHPPFLIKALIHQMMWARKFTRYSGVSSPIKDDSFSTICFYKRRLQQRWRVTIRNDDFILLRDKLNKQQIIRAISQINE